MIPKHIQKHLDTLGFANLRPSQEKAIKAGLFKDNNLLVCTPTASGKTLVGELAILHTIIDKHKKGIYVVPLKALATEKYKEFTKKHPHLKIALSSGDLDSDDKYLAEYDIIITTSEKLDSLLRHHAPWLGRVGVVVIDEVHLLNDTHRGPTLEIVITLLRQELSNLQLIALSATIGNADELATWLDAKLVQDKWRPVRLDKGIFYKNTIHFEDAKKEE
ncbi:DEAD/DEAH box helicase [Candidatus Woesearchaeota archaeon]|nr:DEAD/DEAH box helicase [Candidatus Woesearchaeota archaeon]